MKESKPGGFNNLLNAFHLVCAKEKRRLWSCSFPPHPPMYKKKKKKKRRRKRRIMRQSRGLEVLEEVVNVLNIRVGLVFY